MTSPTAPRPGTRRLPPVVDRLRRLPRRAGLELVRPGRGLAPWRLARMLVPAPFRQVVRSGQPFEVPLDRVMSITGFSWHPAGFSPLTATLTRLLGDPGLAFEDTPLATVHRAIAPTTVREGLLDAGDPDIGPVGELPARYLTQVWVLSERDVRRLAGPPRPDPLATVYLGPTADGDDQLRRLAAIHTSIHEHGYRPEEHHDGLIEGYFLVGDDETWRFVVTDGQHRTAALAVEGATALPVRLWNGPAGVHRDHLDRWTRAAGGPYTPEQATALLDLQLARTGTERALAHGIDPDDLAAPVTDTGVPRADRSRP